MSLGPEAFRVHCSPDEALVRLSGEIDLAAARELAQAFARMPYGTDIDVDVSGVTFIDSTGLSHLVQAAHCHKLVLHGIAPRMRMLIEMMGVVDCFAFGGEPSIVDTTQDPSAVQGVGSGLPLRVEVLDVLVRGAPVIDERPHDASKLEVTFRCTTGGADAVLVGEFTDWMQSPVPMARCEDGFEVTVSLAPGRSYRYKYLLDGTQWVNDLVADRYVENEFGGYDSVRDL